MVLMYWWARQHPVTDAAQEAKVEKNTAVQAYQYFRDICSWRLLNHDVLLMLGGPGVECTLTSLSLDTSPKYGTAVWLLVSVIVNIFIMISSRTIVGVHPHGRCGFLGYVTQATLGHVG